MSGIERKSLLRHILSDYVATLEFESDFGLIPWRVATKTTTTCPSNLPITFFEFNLCTICGNAISKLIILSHIGPVTIWEHLEVPPTLPTADT
jgi:hypothetical protein